MTLTACPRCRAPVLVGYYVTSHDSREHVAVYDVPRYHHGLPVKGGVHVCPQMRLEEAAP